MKLAYVIKKNFKLLIRSKSSAFVIIFGPLLIMLLAGLAFNSPTQKNLTVGVFSSSYSNLSSSFIDELKTNNFTVLFFDSQGACIEKIKQGDVHSCIIFPPNLTIENNKTNEIFFYVDQTRINFVYAILDALSSKIELRSSRISFELTSNLLDVIYNAKAKNEENLLRIVKIKTDIDNNTATLDSMKKKIDSLDLNMVNVDTSSIKTQAEDLLSSATDIKDYGLDAVDNGLKLITDIRTVNPNSNITSLINAAETKLEELNQSIQTLYNATPEQLDELNSKLDNVTSSLTTIEAKFTTAKTSITEASSRIDDVKNSLLNIKDDLNKLKTSIENINDAINSIQVTSAESIVNPIKTTIQPIASTGSYLNYIFPYLIILVIMFISIILSSTLIQMEKSSKAFFRNFVTPTKDITFVMATYLTTLFVLILQITVVLGVSYYFLKTSIFTNVLYTLLLIFFAITLFTVIGMIVGYLFKSEEGTTVISISVASIFLLLSNLIIPLERMSPIIQSIAKYNPYVMLSELLKRLIIFDVTFKDIYLDFLIIAGVTAGLFIVMLLIQKLSVIKYISKVPPEIKAEEIGAKKKKEN